MPAVLDRPASRSWADLLAIIVGVLLLASSIWPGSHTSSADADVETTATSALWLAHVTAGGLAVLAVFVGQQWQRRPLARLLLIGGAVVLFAALFIFRDFTTRALLTTVLPALALLVSASAIGPAPRDSSG